MADWNGKALRLMEFSADSLSDLAIFLGLSQVNTPSSRSSAIECFVTSPDHFLFFIAGKHIIYVIIRQIIVHEKILPSFYSLLRHFYNPPNFSQTRDIWRRKWILHLYPGPLL